jgi:hypothetical protein
MLAPLANMRQALQLSFWRYTATGFREMPGTKSIVGWGLVLLSLIAVIQSARAVGLWEIAGRRYTEHSVQDLPITFAGQAIEIRDNLARTATGSQAASEGKIEVRLNGRLQGVASRAAIRMGLGDIGRYHGWLDAWIFVARANGDSTLWITRRLQAADSDPARFELVVVHANGTVETRTVRGWQLGFDYPSFRSTQFVRSGAWEALPLDVSDLAGLFPILLLIFPLGTLFTGIFLLRRPQLRAPAV